MLTGVGGTLVWMGSDNISFFGEFYFICQNLSDSFSTVCYTEFHIHGTSVLGIGIDVDVGYLIGVGFQVGGHFLELGLLEVGEIIIIHGEEEDAVSLGDAGLGDYFLARFLSDFLGFLLVSFLVHRL